MLANEAAEVIGFLVLLMPATAVFGKAQKVGTPGGCNSGDAHTRIRLFLWSS
jgi:hypothetical protein